MSQPPETSSTFAFPTSPQELFEQYGWYLLAGFIFYYFLWDQVRDKILAAFPTSNNNDPSRIPTSSDMRLHEIRAKQQQQFIKTTQSASKKETKPKLTKKQENMKKTSAYRYMTTGKFDKDDKGGSGGMADASSMPSYRPRTPFQKYGRKPGGGGGGGG
eukprot:181154_1